MKSSEIFIHNNERDELIPADILAIIDAAYMAEDIGVMMKATDAIAAFNEQLEKDFSRPNLKHSVFWHKLVGSGIEGQIYPATDTVIQKINEIICKFVRTELSVIVKRLND